MILIDAVYVNNSGGLVLLKYLIKSIIQARRPAFFLLDERCRTLQGITKYNCEFTRGEKGRKRLYSQLDDCIMSVLCFGNAPPPIKLKVNVVTYFHNLLILEPSHSVSFKKIFITWLKREFIRWKLKNTDKLIVQTTHGKKLIDKVYRFKGTVHILPIFDVSFCQSINSNLKVINQKFLYVSDGNSHKNHIRLLEAWKRIHQNYPNAILHLTVSNNYPELRSTILKLTNEGYNIVNLGFISKDLLNQFYQDCYYCIYPSLVESFGLGLIEAATAGQRIIASDLDYLHSVVKPSAVFDPYDDSSIFEVINLALSDFNLKESKLLVDDKINQLIDLI